MMNDGFSRMPAKASWTIDHTVIEYAMLFAALLTEWEGKLRSRQEKKFGHRKSWGKDDENVCWAQRRPP
jgi:hypothetical protein